VLYVPGMPGVYRRQTTMLRIMSVAAGAYAYGMRNGARIFGVRGWIERHDRKEIQRQYKGDQRKF